jgi:hypothetical protein
VLVAHLRKACFHWSELWPGLWNCLDFQKILVCRQVSLYQIQRTRELPGDLVTMQMVTSGSDRQTTLRGLEALEISGKCIC